MHHDDPSIYSALEAILTLSNSEVAGGWHEDEGSFWRGHVLSGKTYVEILVRHKEEGDDLDFQVLSRDTDEDAELGMFSDFEKAKAAADSYMREKGVLLLEHDPKTRMLVPIGNHPSLVYDKDFGDDRDCKCGHPYYRHFDTYEDMAPVGCKYCGYRCEGFRLADGA